MPYLTRMGAGVFIEPLVVVSLLSGGTWINRKATRPISPARKRHDSSWPYQDESDSEDTESEPFASITDRRDIEHGRSTSPSLLAQEEQLWRKRQIDILGWKKQVTSPNTRVFRGSLLSRLLNSFPFLAECWYWALIYWV